MPRLLVVFLLLCLLVPGSVPVTADVPDDRAHRAGGSVVDRVDDRAAVPPAGTAAAGGPGSTSAGTLQQQFDRSEFVVTVYGNGSAEWTFRFMRTLDNETERRDFQAYADRFNEEPTDLSRDFRRRSETLVSEGANYTGRQMNATGFDRRAYVGSLGNQGVVEMSFLWTGFSPVADGTVTVGDVFEGGLYVRSDQRLVVNHGPGVVFQSASPSPDSISGNSLAGSDSLTWEGERSFTDERPRITLVPPSAVTSTASATNGTAGPSSTTGTGTGGSPPASASPPGGADGFGDGGGMGLLPAVGLGAIVLLGIGAAFAYRSGVFGGGDGTSGDGDGDGGTSAANDGGTGGATAGGDPEPSVPDEELLSDENRVMRLLEANGGRMKQVNIVDETGWSKSKVSMLLSEMEEDEQISKLRVGRENIISKRGMEPDAAGSPFEDEDD